MGRLFDAVACLLGIRHESRYEAEAAIGPRGAGRGSATPARAEECHPAATGRQAVTLLHGAATDWFALDPTRLDPVPVLRARRRRCAPASTRGALAAALPRRRGRRGRRGRRRVAGRCGWVGLTGGVFQNVLLLRLCRERLSQAGFTVLTHRTVPPNDGGLALGQAAVSVLSALDEEGSTAEVMA